MSNPITGDQTTSLYYDKNGTPLPSMEWAKKMATKNYKRVQETTLPDGKWVSTVWLGLNYNFNTTSFPLIFETMVFRTERDLDDLYCERWATLAEAEAGHKRIVEMCLKGELNVHDK